MTRVAVASEAARPGRHHRDVADATRQSVIDRPLALAVLDQALAEQTITLNSPSAPPWMSRPGVKRALLALLLLPLLAACSKGKATRPGPDRPGHHRACRPRRHRRGDRPPPRRRRLRPDAEKTLTAPVEAVSWRFSQGRRDAGGGRAAGGGAAAQPDQPASTSTRRRRMRRRPREAYARAQRLRTTGLDSDADVETARAAAATALAAATPWPAVRVRRLSCARPLAAWSRPYRPRRATPSPPGPSIGKVGALSGLASA